MGLRTRLAIVALVGLLFAGTVSLTGAAPAQAAEWYPVPANRTYTLDGHGFGHGRGLSQWGAQGAATQGLSAAQILDFYYPGTTQTQIGAPTVRVLLTGTATSDLRIDSTVGTTVMGIQDTSSGITDYVLPGSFRVLTTGGTQRILRYDGSTWADLSIGGDGTYQGPLAFWSEDGVTVWTSATTARNYRGSIAVVPTGSGVSTAVNTVNMQEYLRGVVPRESPAWFEPAALQAQTVAARSYAWWDVQTPLATHYDICDTTACQVYGGRSLYTTSSKTWTEQEQASTDTAIAATAGIALYYQGAPAFTQFSASNGGASLAGSVPYLSARLDPYDGIPPQNTNHTWTATLSASYLESTYPAIGTLQGIRIVSRAGLGEWGGYITSMQLVGSNATVSVSTPRFNLKSTWWKPREEGNPYGGFDSLDAVTGNQVRAVGWAADPNSPSAIAVHAYVDGQGMGAYMADAPRPDVAAAIGGDERRGFDIVLPVSQGRHEVCMFAMNVGAGSVNTPLGCRTVDTRGLPIGNIESAAVDGSDAVLSGWTLDPDTTSSLDVHAYVNGVGSGAFTADGDRPDVAAAYPGSGPGHGFSVRVRLQPGINEVCLFAINLPTPGVNPELGCRVLELKVDPFGNFEAASGGADSFTVTGWAVDPETSAPIDVHVYVDGAGTAVATADHSRPDVAAAYPGAGDRHGFSVTVPATPGARDVCVYAINTLQGDVNPLLGCRTVDVGVLPIGRLDAITATAFEAHVVGWALDPDTSAPIDVHLYVDGRFVKSVTASADRPDVAAVYPSSGPAHGIDARLSLPTGNHRVCAFGINVLGAKGNPLLSCADVTIAPGQSLPFGMLDSVEVVNGITVATGWTVEPDAPTEPVTVHFYVDGRFSGVLDAAASRPDVAAAIPGVGPAHGYVGYFALPAGRHTVCTFAINRGAGSVNPALGCASVTVP